MSNPDLPNQPQRPKRESFGMEIGIALMSIVVAGLLLLVGGLIFSWAAQPTRPAVHDNNQDPIVSKYRRVGFEIGLDNENRIHGITAPNNPLLVTNKDLAMITGLPDLQVLDLRGTQISDEALTHLTGLPNLQMLYLGGSVITDTEPTLIHARFTDAAVDPVVQLTTLKLLSLARTDIGDEAVKKLPALTNLEVLFLLGTNITDESVDALSQMKSLKELYLQETAVTPEGLKRLRAALPETEIMPLDEIDAEGGSQPQRSQRTPRGKQEGRPRITRMGADKKGTIRASQNQGKPQKYRTYSRLELFPQGSLCPLWQFHPAVSGLGKSPP